jgi:PAS domain S-box-containing protein
MPTIRGTSKRRQRRGGGSAVQQHDEVRRTRRLLLLMYAALSVAIVSVGFVSYANYATSLRAGVGSQLTAIVNLKSEEISSWRKERVGDAEMLRGAPGFSALVEHALNGPDKEAAREELTVWFERIRGANDYARVSLIDAVGTRIVSSPEADPAVDSALSIEAANAMRTGSVSIADFHSEGAGSENVHLSIVVPILDELGTGRPIAVVALMIDPSVFLYPYIQQWPGDSKTGETLLVKRDGADVLFLNELKYQKDTALNLRIPLTRTDVPSVQAALGHEGAMDGVDYRGERVVAAARQVPGAPWAVVARVDAAEVYAPLRARLWLTVLLVFGVLGTGLLGILFVLRMQAARLYRERWQQEAERVWLSSAIEGSLNEVYAFDAETLVYDYVNRGGIDNIGYTMAELRAMTPLDLRSESAEAPFRSLIAPLVTGERQLLDYETTYRRKDGTEYPVEVHLQLTERGGKQVFLAFINDISVRRAAEAELVEYREHLEQAVEDRTQQLHGANEELEAVNEELAASNEELQTLYEEAAESGRELERLNSELEHADSAKSDFLASMSHELRTPLNSVIGFSDIMLQGLAGELNDEQGRQLEMINSSGKHLLLLVNDVLDLSKVEAGRMDAEMAPFDLSAEVLSLLETLRPHADACELSLVTEGIDEPFEIVSDARMIRQILLNLLSNAIKFTDEGTVRVSVKNRNELVEIAVTDTGPGIAAKDQRRIFDAFTQVRVRDHRPDGTGLGLAVSASLASLLGGDLSVRSKQGHGSTFTFILPRTPSSRSES